MVVVVLLLVLRGLWGVGLIGAGVKEVVNPTIGAWMGGNTWRVGKCTSAHVLLAFNNRQAPLQDSTGGVASDGPAPVDNEL